MCRDNGSVLYHRLPKLFEDLALARGDGRRPRILELALLILDDWAWSRSKPPPVTISSKSSRSDAAAPR
jgi:DNA replication protein DnaC